MSAALTQIKVAYEEHNMAPDAIASEFDLDVVAVKSGLMQVSSKYRKDCGKEDEDDDTLNFSNDQLKEVNQTLFDLAMGAEDEHLRFKAAAYIRDDKKGRLDALKNMNGLNINFNLIQQAILAGRASLDATRAKSKQIVDVEIEQIK